MARQWIVALVVVGGFTGLGSCILLHLGGLPASHGGIDFKGRSLAAPHLRGLCGRLGFAGMALTGVMFGSALVAAFRAFVPPS